MQDLDVLDLEGFFLFCTLLKVSKQDINYFIYLALTIIDLKVVIREFLSPANLFGAQTFYVHKPIEVIIVDEYENLMFAVFQIVSLGLKSPSNC